MELKRLISHFTYRIEPKPGGGFIAHAADPTVAPLEAPTREELQKKIQENILPGLIAQFPGLNLPLENQDLRFAFHIERKPGDGFVIHSSNPKAEPIEVLTHNDVESYFAEKITSFIGKHLPPELSQVLAAQDNSGDIQVFVKRKTSVTAHAGSHSLSLEPTGGSGGTISNTPIEAEGSRSSKILAFLLLVLVAGALMYFFLHYR